MGMSPSTGVSLGVSRVAKAIDILLKRTGRGEGDQHIPLTHLSEVVHR